MSRQHTDHYTLLGIGPGASAADVGRAYRRAARATHPDVHPDDVSAAERFRAVTTAYEILSDPSLRAAYDRAHPPVRRSTPIAAHYGRGAVAPVHLGRHKPQPEPLHPCRDGTVRVRTVRAQTDDIFGLAEALSRLFLGWAFL